MTNVRVMKSFKNHIYVLDEEATAERKDRDPLTEEEIQGMLDKADTIDKTYFRLRAKTIVAIARVFGKRRSEIASLMVKDLKIDNGDLVITFTLSKKRKRGLFQYIQFLEDKVKKGEMTDDELQTKTQGELKDEWLEWQKTEFGVRVKKDESPHSVAVTSPYAKIIIDYWEYVKERIPESVYLFPAGKAIFDDYEIDDKHHISDWTLLYIVKELNPNCWLHLFREMVGGEVAKEHGRTLESARDVMEELDLANETTAYRYIKRSVPRKREMKG